MDTTEQYIKMCEKAEEIQKGQPPLNYPQDFYKRVNAIQVWLPRQDQLQEMVVKKSDSLVDIMGDIDKFVFPSNTGKTDEDWEQMDYISKLYSMEQLWLAFVMKEKFNKIWNGEDWI